MEKNNASDKNTEDLILEHTKKIRKNENERMKNMTKKELLENMIETNDKALEYARKHNIKTIKITSDNKKEDK